MRTPLKYPMRRGQQGAALIIGLILLMVLTLLAISGMNSASLEFIMAGNEQYRANAFQAAEAGIEQSMVQGNFNPGAPAQALAGATTANDSWAATINPPVNSQPMTLVNGSNGSVVNVFFFEVQSIGQAVRGAQANNLQGVAVMSPAGSNQSNDPNLPNPALVP
jgi:type IV pilus assembly protein PilX